MLDVDRSNFTLQEELRRREGRGTSSTAAEVPEACSGVGGAPRQDVRSTSGGGGELVDNRNKRRVTLSLLRGSTVERPNQLLQCGRSSCADVANSWLEDEPNR